MIGSILRGFDNLPWGGADAGGGEGSDAAGAATGGGAVLLVRSVGAVSTVASPLRDILDGSGSGARSISLILDEVPHVICARTINPPTRRRSIRKIAALCLVRGVTCYPRAKKKAFV